MGFDGAGVGDPTEVALLLGAHDIGCRQGDVERSFPRLAEIGFRLRPQMHDNIHAHAGRRRVSFTKGARRGLRSALDRGRDLCRPRSFGARMHPVGHGGGDGRGRTARPRDRRIAAVALELPPTGDVFEVERDLTLLGFVGL